MPLQNRVTPRGVIERNRARGTLMGNRGGRIHDSATQTLLRRRWASKHWIICVTEFKNRWRPVMGSSSYTELFFLDEVTALAAGHRPCYECQRRRALEFAAAFVSAHGCAQIYAGDIDDVLHGQRLASGGPTRDLPVDAASALPDGAMVADGDASFAVRGGRLLPWSHAGYGAPVSFADRPLVLLTPPATLAAIRAGFAPRFHQSAGA